LKKLLRKYTGTLIIIICAVIGYSWWQSNRAIDDGVMAQIPRYENFDDTSILAGEGVFAKLEPTYLSYFAEKERDGIQDVKSASIVIPGGSFSAASDAGFRTESGIGGRAEPSAVLDEEDSWVEYEVDIPEDGFYQMAMTYYALEGKRSSVLRTLQIDGEFPFIQLKRLEFTRMWKEAGEVWSDNQGNQYNPAQEEVFGWQRSYIRDADGKAYEPYRFHLTKGKHTIRITMTREPAAIGELEIMAPQVLPTYEEYVNAHKASGATEVKGQYIKIQAEDVVLKSSPTLRRAEVRDPATEPFNKNGVGLNTIGGNSWRNGGQWLEWDFEAPESGFYNIGMKVGSWFLDGMPIQRTIMIDGEVPFQELNAVSIKYRNTWHLKKLGDEEPYLIYLEEGKHKLRMQVQIGAFGQVFENVQNVSSKMAYLSREVLLYTGTNPDPNREWNLSAHIPNLIERLHLMAIQLDDAINILHELGVERESSQLSTLRMARNQLIDLSNDTDTIPARIKQISDTQSSLGTWINGLSLQALQMDYIVIKSTDKKWPNPQAHWLDRTVTTLSDFALSFKKDYRGVGNVFESGEEGETIEVWITRGREWAEIIKQMADEDFTSQTGIRVNINIVPATDKTKLLLSTSAGLQPDVALGVDSEVPIDFAIRNSLVDLTQFDDYEEVAARFRPGALIPYQYNGGSYAIPEDQNFTMLFYRKDIMEELGITKIPETWEDVLDIIPILQQGGMDFYYPHAPNSPELAINEFSPFLFQKGGEYYRNNGTESNLDSPEAMEAMQMWTELFTNYKISKDANFYNRFRTGEMPIGVADYSTYVLLSTAAPELTGWWGMAPMPGIRQEDGSINRSTGGLAKTAIVFSKSEKQDESWQFIKWWTSADVQERFGTELEAVLGVEARWNTANVEALQRLPWPKDDINAILEQWKWFKEREIVLGGYYTTRYIANTWNDIVLNGKNQREAIEDAVIEINREIAKKREEFGLDQQSSASESQEGAGAR